MRSNSQTPPPSTSESNISIRRSLKGLGNNSVYGLFDSDWKSADVTISANYGVLSFNSDADANITYDLTSNTPSYFIDWSLNGLFAAVEATLNLSNTNITNFSVSSATTTDTTTTGTPFDPSDAFKALAPSPSAITLTTGTDTVVCGPGNVTVYGTAATLNAGDSLTGGAGTDVLDLIGSGTFRVDQLSTFTGFENITLNNSTWDAAVLYLGSQSIAVTAYGVALARAGWDEVFLGTGAATLEGVDAVISASPSNWNAANSFAGVGDVWLNAAGSNGATYDLTTNMFSDVRSVIDESGSNLTLKINSAVAAGVSNFYSNLWPLVPTDQLVTSDAALDLSHSKVQGLTVASTNATGTNFTVGDIGTALEIWGGPGIDTITAPSLGFSADERNFIFATTSVERIVDAFGTYTAPPPNNVFALTTGIDTFVGGPEDDTVDATAATLNSGDSLDGGGGNNVLALWGGGAFYVDQLATFTGFESITLENYGYSGPADLFLGSQSIAVRFVAGPAALFLGVAQSPYREEAVATTK